MRRLGLLLAPLLIVAIAALAQTDGADETNENGFLANLLQNTLSAPGRQIRLENVSGLLSSTARIGAITVSDDAGVWARVEGAEIDWSRAALLLGRVNVNSVSAERVEVLRQPVPADTPPAPEASAEPFALPELPVSIDLSELAIATLAFDESVFGEAAELGVTGSFRLADGALDADLAVERQDAPGGSLDLAAAYANETRALDLDIRLQEPEGGLVSKLLNIEGEPAIDLALTGAGPLDNVDVTFSLDAAGDRIAGGTVALRAVDAGLRFDADFAGGLEPLIPAEYRDFFAGQSAITAQGVTRTGGGLNLDGFAVRNDALDLSGRAETADDWFPRRLSVEGTLGDPTGPAITLPVPGAETTLNSASLYVTLGDGDRWTGRLALDRLSAADILVEDFTLDMGGRARNLDDPAARDLSITLEGLATGVSSADPDIGNALGDRIDIFLDAAIPPEGPARIDQFQVSGDGLSAFASGTVRDLVYTGTTALRVSDLSPLSGLAGRDLGGSVDLTAEGVIGPLTGAIDLALDGTATDLLLGDPRLDALLAGETRLSGRAVRDASGIRADALRLSNAQLEFSSDGRVSTASTDIVFEARLADLGILDPRASGALTASGAARGQGRNVDVSLEAAIPDGQLLDSDIEALRLAIDGTLSGSDVTATIDGGGRVGDQTVTLGGDVAVEGETRRVQDLVLAIGPNRLTGDASLTGTGPVTGDLSLRAPDIASLATLALIEATGALDADITLSEGDPGQDVAITTTARNLLVAGNAISSLDLDATVRDALGLPLIDGSLEAEGITAGGLDVATLSARAEQTDPDRMGFSADARLAIGTLADLSGSLERLDPGFALTLDTLRLRQDGVAATLAAPATVTLVGEDVTLTPLRLDLGQGALVAQGSAGETLDLSLDITDLPVDLANLIQPGLGLTGTVNGTARATGPRTAPDIRFDLAAADLSGAATRAADLPPINVDARGQTSDGRLELDASVAGAGGLAASTRGSVPLGEGEIDLAVDLGNFPLGLVDALAGRQGLRGAITGTASVSGTPAAPRATFALDGSDLSATVLAQNGVAPLSLGVRGGFADNTLRIESAELANTDGLRASASGTVPLSGPGVDVTASGVAPLSLADVALAGRDAQATGDVTFDATLSGALSDLRYGGSVTLRGGTVVDPATNLRLENVTLDAGLTGDSVTLRTFSAQSVSGGEITASGSVSLDAGRGFPADLGLRVNDLRYTDGSFVTTRVNADLALNGPITADGGTLSGTIELGETEISVAEGLGGNAQAALDQVTHIRPAPAVRATLDRAQVGEPATPSPTAGTGIGLDIRIDAPRRIFVRGRGLDVELGGSLRIRGTSEDIQPIGEFEMRRGRLAILGQRIDFEEGALRLIGDLDPQLYFVARTVSEDVTAIVTVEGRASDPSITFSSEPELPEDEVLSRILFNRATADLSTFQLAQLAAAAAELAGGGGPGILSQLRGATGLDDLDVVTEADGSTAVRAGKYISDEVYLDVQTGSDGLSRAQVNYDVNDKVTIRGSVASDGNTVFGLFYERDY